MPKKKTEETIVPSTEIKAETQVEEQAKPVKKNSITKEQKGVIQKEPMTTTKKILWVTWITFIALIVLQVLGHDMGTPLEIVGGVMTTIITATYLWKSKAENKLKITISALDSLADKYGIENVIPLVQEIVDD